MKDKQGLGKHNLLILKQVFDYYGHYDVDCPRHSGIYDVRTRAVNIWSRPWRVLSDKKVSTLVGMIYVDWQTGEVSVKELSSVPVARRVFVYTYHNINRDKRELTNPYSLFHKHLSKAEAELL